ncbi:ComEA family DNA-binding protein [Pseudomonas mosselii]|uniref:ComEA family DNA-binding protein n=1 Tax=Pseudomonas mosselii TaxID=78327 RepID=UPI001FF9F494|nr:ComEA family DNA-binding protein [Pseudomonas mosselii]UPF05446.1 ComEA family DNA-binding protein [Pseudomonas mosselii]
MRNNVLAYIFLPLFTCLSFSLAAAPGTTSAEGQAIPSSAMQELHIERINLNRVDALTLQRELKGIGKAKADAIVAYRDTQGGFQSIDELLEIKGIGSALLERNRERLTVE